MKKTAIIFLFSFFLYECNKEEPVHIPNTIIQFDTLKPLNYYPVYPGSYWQYIKNDTDTITINTSPNYLKHNYLQADGKYTDTTYVPFLAGEPIYQYNKIEHILPPFGDYYQTWPILSEEVGFQFEREWIDNRYGDFREKIKVEQKTVNKNNDSILILRGHWVYGPNVNNVSVQEYTKNIGLSLHIIVDTVAKDTLFKLKLINYKINR